jgi:ubiquinone/menaquinone biosynthesis C-methylase UbiE
LCVCRSRSYGRRAIVWHPSIVGLDETLAGQKAYYRDRAPEYDLTSLGDTEASSRWFGEIIDRLDPTGDLLEIACGTGLWTQHLVESARSVVALDSSPEMIELARSRVGDQATFILADVFAWKPERRYDSVFFGFWLSHVPPQSFGAFWDLLKRCLAPGGRVQFVDEGAPRASREPTAAFSPIVKRRLRNGTIHEIVKIFYDPDELLGKLGDLGWAGDIEVISEGLLIGTARPEEPAAD